MVQQDDPLHSAKETADNIHISPATMATWRALGKGPRYVKVGRAVYYRQSAINDWLKSQERDPAKKGRA